MELRALILVQRSHIGKGLLAIAGTLGLYILESFNLLSKAFIFSRGHILAIVCIQGLSFDLFQLVVQLFNPVKGILLLLNCIIDLSLKNVNLLAQGIEGRIIHLAGFLHKLANLRSLGRKSILQETDVGRRLIKLRYGIGIPRRNEAGLDRGGSDATLHDRSTTFTAIQTRSDKEVLRKGLLHCATTIKERSLGERLGRCRLGKCRHRRFVAAVPRRQHLAILSILRKRMDHVGRSDKII